MCAASRPDVLTCSAGAAVVAPRHARASASRARPA